MVWCVRPRLDGPCRSRLQCHRAGSAQSKRYVDEVDAAADGLLDEPHDLVFGFPARWLSRLNPPGAERGDANPEAGAAEGGFSAVAFFPYGWRSRKNNRMTEVDAFSLTTVPVEQLANGIAMKSATAFVWKHGPQHY